MYREYCFGWNSNWDKLFAKFVRAFIDCESSSPNSVRICKNRCLFGAWIERLFKILRNARIFEWGGNSNCQLIFKDDIFSIIRIHPNVRRWIALSLFALTSLGNDMLELFKTTIYHFFPTLNSLFVELEPSSSLEFHIKYQSVCE